MAFRRHGKRGGIAHEARWQDAETGRQQQSCSERSAAAGVRVERVLQGGRPCRPALRAPGARAQCQAEVALLVIPTRWPVKDVGLAQTS